MRPVLLGCLAIALTAAETTTTPAPEAPVAPVAPVVTFVPMRCDLRSDLRFDAAGKPEREHGVLAITLRAELPAGLTVDGWGATTLTRVQTESGEMLKPLSATAGEAALARMPREARARLNLIQRREAMGGDQPTVAAVPLTLRLVPPLRPSFTLARLEGSVELRWRRGEARSVRVAPIVAAPDAPIAIEGVPAGTITIRTRSEREIGVTWSDALAVRLQRVRFEDADGGELRQRGRGMTTRNGSTEYTYQVAVPEGGALVVEVLPEAVTSLIPIVLEGVPLAGTGAAPLVSEPLPELGQGQE